MAGSAPRRSRPGSAISSSRTAIPRPRRPTRCSISSSSTGPSRSISRRSRPSAIIAEHARHSRLRRQALQPDRHLGDADGRRDAPAHGEYRDGVRAGPPRSEEPTARPSSKPRRRCSASRWTRCSAISSTSARSDRTRARAASICFCRRGTRARCRRAISSSSRRPTPSATGMRGFKVDGKTDQAVALMKQTKVYPLAKAAEPAEDGVPQRLRPSHRHDPLRHYRVLRDAGPARQRGAGRGLHAARTLLHAGHRHREGQAVQPRRQRQGAALGSRADGSRDGAGQQLRVARSRHVLLHGSQVAVRRRRALHIS